LDSLAKNRVFDVARVLGDFMMFLHDEHGVDLNDVTCIGFSLGGDEFPKELDTS
jgi:hypothetical protein